MIAEKESRSGDRGYLRLRYERGVGGVIPMAIERVEGNSGPAPSVLESARFVSVGSITQRIMRVSDSISLYL